LRWPFLGLLEARVEGFAAVALIVVVLLDVGLDDFEYVVRAVAVEVAQVVLCLRARRRERGERDREQDVKGKGRSRKEIFASHVKHSFRVKLWTTIESRASWAEAVAEGRRGGSER